MCCVSCIMNDAGRLKIQANHMLKNKIQNNKKLNHPFSSSYLGLGSGEVQTALLSATLSGETSRCSQASHYDIFSPAAPGTTPGFLPVGHAWSEHLMQEVPATANSIPPPAECGGDPLE